MVPLGSVNSGIRTPSAMPFASKSRSILPARSKQTAAPVGGNMILKYPSAWPTTGRQSASPSSRPSCVPSVPPSSLPSLTPSSAPSAPPSSRPSSPFSCPSASPSSRPSCVPSVPPSAPPSSRPSCVPLVLPSSAISDYYTLTPVDDFADDTYVIPSSSVSVIFASQVRSHVVWTFCTRYTTLY